MKRDIKFFFQKHFFFISILLVILAILAGFSCAPIVTIEDEGPTGPSAAGPPINVTVDSLNTSKLGLVWSPPTNLGTKDGGIVLIPDELSYRVYYLQANENEEKPLAEVVKNKALGINPPKQLVTNSGITRSQIINLKSGERYFLAVETFNPFASAETLSTVVVEVYTQVVFEGILTYSETEHELKAHDDALIISPDPVPTTSSGDAVSYSFDKIDGNLSDTVFAVDESSGVVTINPTTTGTAMFIVRAEARGYLSQKVTFTITIEARESGAVTGTMIDNVEGHSFEVRWTEPDEKGTRQDGRILRSDELVYRVYYLADYLADYVGDLPPNNAGDLIRDAKSVSQFEEVQGTMIARVSARVSARIIGLSAETRYFVTVETYNSYLDTGTASVEVEGVVEGRTTVTATDFSGDLTYADDEYSYPASLAEATITPSTRPTNLNLEYGLYRRSGVLLSRDTRDVVLIDSDTGVITVKPSNAMQAGTANYIVFVRVTGFNTQYVAITIRITQIDISVTPYYADEAKTDLPDLPVPFGQAIWDASLAYDEEVVRIESSDFVGDYMIKVGDGEGNYETSFEKSVFGNRIIIQKSEFTNYKQLRNNGAVIGISGRGIAGIQELAISRPHEIRTWQDLQAMRVNLDGDYVLMNDIELPHAAEGTSNFEPVGSWGHRFSGSLDGTNGNTERFRIIGLRIESNSNGVGLFGMTGTNNRETVIAKNLELVDSTVIGRSRVGSLVGYLYQATVKNVAVELSRPNAGRVEGIISKSDIGSGNDIGGLVGFNQASIIDSYANIPVKGTWRVGGLVGNNDEEAVVSGYASGSVTGIEHVGGLIGWNYGGDYSNVSGYATGAVLGYNLVGGLVGWTSGGTITGYATGTVEGNRGVGGLLGHAQDDSKITGYARGTVTGETQVGGLVGYVKNGIITAYSRSTVYRNKGSYIEFGKTVGQVKSDITKEGYESIQTRTYSSQGSLPESTLYNIDGTRISSPSGEHGISVDINNVSSSSAFSGLSFGTTIGQWTWVGSGKWPAINLGDIAPANEQPID